MTSNSTTRNAGTPRVITVLGATGAQGGGLVRALLAHPEFGFVPRAVTRNRGSEAARQLVTAGVEVVEADLDDMASLERAFAGAHGAFCVTSYWEHGDPDLELTQAAHLATAAKTAGVRHAIWSTLEDSRQWVPLTDDRMPTLLDRFKVPHFDGKAEANCLFIDSGVPTTLLHTSFYWDNFIHLGLGPQTGPDGILRLTIPMGDARLFGIAAEDIGASAVAIFREGHDTAHAEVGIAGEHLTGEQLASGFTRALGREVRYEPLTWEQFRQLGVPGADDLANMFQFFSQFSRELTARRPVGATRVLHPGLLSFDDWLSRNAARIPLAAVDAPTPAISGSRS